ncbi:MAG: biopolymer transporter ExbD [Crocinitomicaceae bacterium]|nr:biopolymer transporter ExbD [Crocinitomicaceae bacterium]|tara:strand:+ start:39185 stop:39772 length:588 start_codon:yes stop_codon:yes gene_type:complete
MAKSPPEINAGSMADIAFLLLVFFLVTTTMDTDFGLSRKLPPPPEDDQEIVDIKQRNVMQVLVNANDQLLVQGELMVVEDLKEKAKEFIANASNAEHLPEKKATEVPFFGNVMVSKQVISLQNDNGTSYNMYIQVQNELAKAYNELRNELSEQQFGKSYDYYVEIKDKDRVKAIRKVFPQRISEAEPKDIGGGNE